MQNQNQLNAVCGLFPVLRKVIGAQAGSFLGVSWVREVKTRKGVDSIVTKSVRTVVRTGISYDSREVVQTARANGDAPSENAGLPWGNWLSFPYVISHVRKGDTAVNYYVRLYPVRDASGNARACKVVYRENGKRIDSQRARELCLASEFSDSRPTDCYTLSLANLKRVL